MRTDIFYPAQLISKQFAAPGILLARFSRPERFSFTAGQFVQVQLAGAVRTYSICSLPNADFIELCVKVLPGGAISEPLAALSVGEEIKISAPAGQFIVRPNHASNKIFIVAGTGVAPVRPMVHELAAANSKTTLLFGLRYEEDVYFEQEFEDLARTNKNFKFILTLSQPTTRWRGNRGRVTEIFPKILDTSAEFYLCGSLEMVKEVRQLLTKAHIPPERIHFEVF
jgi:ferredoxin-NADP reductase